MSVCSAVAEQAILFGVLLGCRLHRRWPLRRDRRACRAAARRSTGTARSNGTCGQRRHAPWPPSPILLLFVVSRPDRRRRPACDPPRATATGAHPSAAAPTREPHDRPRGGRRAPRLHAPRRWAADGAGRDAGPAEGGADGTALARPLRRAATGGRGRRWCAERTRRPARRSGARATARPRRPAAAETMAARRPAGRWHRRGWPPAGTLRRATASAAPPPPGGRARGQRRGRRSRRPPEHASNESIRPLLSAPPPRGGPRALVYTRGARPRAHAPASQKNEKKTPNPAPPPNQRRQRARGASPPPPPRPLRAPTAPPARAPPAAAAPRRARPPPRGAPPTSSP